MSHTVIISILIAAGLIVVYPIILLQRMPAHCNLSSSIRDEILEINQTLDSILDLVRRLLERITEEEEEEAPQ